MAANDIPGSDRATARHFGAGPINTSSGSGRQINNTISGGSGNTQYNATNQYFHGIQAPDEVQLDEDFRKALFLTSPEIDRRNMIDIKEGRVSNTCEWIRTTKEYEAFVEGTHRMLWIWGEPGKGKTMLSIFISQELAQKNKTIYFFCRAEHDKRNTAVAILRGLLWHLSGTCPELTGVLRKKLEPAVKDALASRETLWTSFRDLVVAVQSERLYCLIDGLDECDESSQQWLARKFVSLHDDDDTGSCSIVVVSRYLVELKDIHQVNLDSDYKEQVRSDVKVFVGARTQELFQRITFSDTHRHELREKLLEGAQDSFLWVGFAMIDLLRQKNENGVMRALGRLPTDLFQLYERMLRDIQPDRRELSLYVLRSVTLASRPLTVYELAFVASCFSVRSNPLITWQTISDLVEGCGPLLRINDGIVTLVHESARDYAKGAVFPDGLGLQPRKTHFKLAWACIDALTQRAQREPLATYASAFWPHHAIESDVLAKELFSHPSCFFARSSELRSKWWVRHEHSLYGLRFTGVPEIPQIHMACFLGIKFWVEDILDNQKSPFRKISLMLRDPVTRRDHNGWTPLHWAAFRSRVSIAELLLNRGANPYTKAHQFDRTALHLAAALGDEVMVELLLRHMVNADTQDEFGHTALHAAADQGHQTVVKLLLGRGANVNARAHGWNGPDDQTALHRASAAGHTALVKLLIDHGADVNVEDEHGETALRSATQEVATVRILLDHGADVNTKNNPLLSAASNRAEDTIRLLLDHGADINATDNGGTHILYYAFDQYRGTARDEATVTLLLEHHADINARNRRGQTALLEILERRYDESLSEQGIDELGVIVRAMIKHGAQFDAETAEGKTILQLIPQW
jgi:ankyrin repeat protein